MNGDIIYRQDAIEYLMTNMCWYNEDGYEETEDEKRNAITDLINGVPSAQPGRKKGKWITEVKHYKDESQEFYYEHTRCSNCGAKKRIGWYDANYCPNCGARMDGESDV